MVGFSGMRRIALILFASILLIYPGAAQLRKMLEKTEKIKIPGVDSLFREEPAISTSIKDAQFEISFLDDWSPPELMNMALMPVNKDGYFVLFPGVYIFEAQSYCLHAGTYSPSRGNGYIYAPLKGKSENFVRSILRHSIRHPEIPQKDIQLLIWAIISRTKLEKLSPGLQGVASTLLDPEELKQLRKNALDYMPDLLKTKALRQLSPVLQKIYEAENNLRRVMAAPQATYEQAERVAVLTGEPAMDEGDREVPAGRWSYHPEGYFLRFRPFGYSHTQLEISIPEKFIIVWDESGRIRSVADSKENVVEIEYGDESPASIPADQPIRACVFKQVRLLEKNPSSEERETRKNWENGGWTLVGVPREESIPSYLRGFAHIERRHEASIKQKKELVSLINTIRKIRKTRPSAQIRNLSVLMNLYHLKKAFDEWLESRVEPSAHEELLLKNLIMSAWQFAFHLEAQEKDLALAASPGMPQSEFDPPVDPSGSVATPGQTGRQRIGISSRCKEAESSSSLSEAENALVKALQAKGYDVNADSVHVYQKNGLTCFAVRLGKGGNPLPSIPCIEQQIQQGNVKEGSVEGAKTLLIGCIQQSGGVTRVTAREVDVETGEIGRRGSGDSEGTGQNAIEDAMEKALDALKRW